MFIQKAIGAVGGVTSRYDVPDEVSTGNFRGYFEPGENGKVMDEHSP